jgi:uncharacterized membrane protein YtjA (UPF0391 family)
MLIQLGIIFLAIAIIAGIFGFRGLSRVTTTVAKILFFIAIVGFVVSLLVWLLF